MFLKDSWKKYIFSSSFKKSKKTKKKKKKKKKRTPPRRAVIQIHSANLPVTANLPSHL